MKMLKKIGNAVKLLTGASILVIATAIIVHKNPEEVDNLVETSQEKLSKKLREMQVKSNPALATVEELKILKTEKERKIEEQIRKLIEEQKEIRDEAFKKAMEIKTKAEEEIAKRQDEIGVLRTELKSSIPTSKKNKDSGLFQPSN